MITLGDLILVLVKFKFVILDTLRRRTVLTCLCLQNAFSGNFSTNVDIDKPSAEIVIVSCCTYQLSSSSTV